MRPLTDADVARHAELLRNRLVKRRRHLAARFSRANIEAYRLYDWDIPEVRACVDWYAGHLVAAEYARAQTDAVAGWLEKVVAPGAAALGVPLERVHLKRRRTGHRGHRYDRLDERERRIEVRERDLVFLVNLDDYIDTGLFTDHRETRRIVGAESCGRRVLNLYAYTGTFTCYAAAGGATRTVTVDLSGRYLDWARDNLELNALADDERHALVRADVATYLTRTRETFDLAIVDPPSYSSRGGGFEGAPDGPFDVNRDHPALLRAVLARVTPGGRIYFSTNHQRFEPDLAELGAATVREITAETVPEDHRNPQVHRTFVVDR